MDNPSGSIDEDRESVNGMGGITRAGAGAWRARDRDTWA